MNAQSQIFVLKARVLHWLMAMLILAMLFVGVGMVASVGEVRTVLIAWHRPLGVLILLLVVARVVVRLRNPPPALPADLPVLMRVAARASHLVLYALMFLQPLTGWAMTSASGIPVELGWGLFLPALLPESAMAYAWLRTAHGVLAYAFFLVIFVHIGAALYHGLIRRDGVLRAMVGARTHRKVVDPLE